MLPRQFISHTSLHHLFPSQHSDVLCPLYGILNKDEQLLCTCPFKRSLWSTIASSFLLDPAVFDFSHLKIVKSKLYTFHVHLLITGNYHVTCGIIYLWKAHWIFTFNNPSFHYESKFTQDNRFFSAFG